MDKVLWLPPEYNYYRSPFLYSSWIGVESDGGGGVAQLSTLGVNLQSLILIREVMRQLSLNISQDATVMVQ